MKLFLISQSENSGWDTYDSAVVAAESEEEARRISPRSYTRAEEPDWSAPYSPWCSSPEAVTVVYLGEAVEGTLKSVICASFNAG